VKSQNYDEMLEVVLTMAKENSILINAAKKQQILIDRMIDVLQDIVLNDEIEEDKFQDEGLCSNLEPEYADYIMSDDGATIKYKTQNGQYSGIILKDENYDE